MQVFQISLNLRFFNKCESRALCVPGPGLALGNRNAASAPAGAAVRGGDINAVVLDWREMATVTLSRETPAFSAAHASP